MGDPARLAGRARRTRQGDNPLSSSPAFHALPACLAISAHTLPSDTTPHSLRSDGYVYYFAVDSAGRKAKVTRRTVDLSGYPNLVVIYLDMRVNTLTSLKTMIGFGPKIAKSVEAQPAGLLLHETFLFSLLPPHVGMRQYWRDFESLESWARSEPHRVWWQQFLRNSRGTGFWHEAYFMRGSMEAVYDDMINDIGFLCFAPVQPAQGRMFSARGRAQQPGEPATPIPVSEDDLYS